MWIFGSWRKDASWLYLPGLIALVLAAILRPSGNSWTFLLFAFVAQGFLDSGHVYTTLWRTYFNGVERRRTARYIWIPLALFVGFFFWCRLGIPFLGAFIIYATLFHNVRQFFGISKWYQKLSGHFRKDSDHLLYFLCFAPVVMAHFRSDIEWNAYYTRADIVFWPQPFLFKICLYIYLTILLLWFIYEIRMVARSRGELPRALSVGFPALLYGLAFLVGRTQSQILFPLVVSHGVAYIALVALSVSRIGRPQIRPGWVLWLVLFTALVAGGLERVIESEIDFTDPAMAVGIALVLTPLFCHYLFDAFLWRGDHPEAKVLFDPESQSKCRIY